MVMTTKLAVTALRCAGLILALASCAPCGLGQGAAPGPIEPRQGMQPEQPPANLQKPSIRVRVNEVTAPVTVRNRNGEMVFDLTQKDFRIFDNGVPQKIEHFDLGVDALSVVLVVETSSRIEALLPAVKKTGIVFTQTVMAKSGDAAVIGFDDSVELLAKFTNDADRIQNVIEHIKEGTSGALLYDAMMRGITLLDEQPPARRRILLVMAEARDRGATANSAKCCGRLSSPT